MIPEELAKFMHENYEELSKEKNWDTQEKCKVPFNKLPKENKEVMIAMAEKVIKEFGGEVIKLHRDVENLRTLNNGKFIDRIQKIIVRRFDL